MAKDLKLRAVMDAKSVHTEIGKIISDIERMAKAQASGADRAAQVSEKAANKAITNEERVLRERIRIQRNSVSLLEKQAAAQERAVNKWIASEIKAEENARKAKEASEKEKAKAQERAAANALASEDRAAKERIRIQRASAALADRQEKEAANRSARANQNSLQQSRDMAEATLKVERKAALAEASVISDRFDRRLSIERVRHAQILADLKGNDRAIEAEIRRSTAVQNQIRMDKANLPNTPFQQLLGGIKKGAGFQDGIAGIVGMAGAAVGATVAISALKSGINEVMDASMEMTTLVQTLGYVAGSAEGAQKEFDFLMETAMRLGLNIRDVAPDFASLAVAAKGTKLEGEGLRTLFTGLSEGSTVLHLSAQRTAQSINAFQQMLSKGKIQSQEVVLQFGNAFQGGLKLMADALGKTTPEFLKMMETGQLTGDKVAETLEKVGIQMHKQFGGAAVEAADNARQSITKVKNIVFESSAAVGEVFVNAVGLAAKAVLGLGDAYDVVSVAARKANKEAFDSKLFSGKFANYGDNAEEQTAKAGSAIDDFAKKLQAAYEKKNPKKAAPINDTAEQIANQVKLEKELQDAVAESQADGNAKKIAQENLRYERSKQLLLGSAKEKELIEKIHATNVYQINRDAAEKFLEAEARTNEEARAAKYEASKKLFDATLKAEGEQNKRIIEQDRQTDALRSQYADMRIAANEDVAQRERDASDKRFADMREAYAGNEAALTVISQMESAERVRIAKAENDSKNQMMTQFVGSIGNLLTALGKKNRSLAKAGQVVQIGEGIANTALGVTKALSAAAPPWNFIMAGTVAAAGAAQVATIANQKYATGTDFAPGGMALVGEHGPERVFLPRGARVDTATETRQSMGFTHNGNVSISLTMPSGTTQAQANQIGAAVATGYLEELKAHRKRERDADYYLGARK